MYRLIRVAALYESLCTSPPQPLANHKTLTKQRREIIPASSLAVTLSSHCRYCCRAHFAARFRTPVRNAGGIALPPVHTIGIVGFSCVLLVSLFRCSRLRRGHGAVCRRQMEYQRRESGESGLSTGENRKAEEGHRRGAHRKFCTITTRVRKLASEESPGPAIVATSYAAFAPVNGS